jgi:uncharacterized repeat protein (TIGR03847 family)
MISVSRRLFVFDDPDRFIAGALGQPGDRTFYLQVRQGSAVVSVSLEKTQVAALAGHVAELLDALAVAPVAVTPYPDEAPLDEPVGELFRAGALALTWNGDAERVVIEAQPLDQSTAYREVPDEDPDGPDLLRVSIGTGHARGFVARAAEVVAGGRPLCPFCGQPLEATGHFCPRSNGQLN